MYETSVSNALKNIIVDCSGDPSFRKWDLFIDHADIIFFVIDSTDQRRININKELIANLVSYVEEKADKMVKIMFLFNKTDLEDSLSFKKLKSIYTLEKYSNFRNLRIFSGRGSREKQQHKFKNIPRARKKKKH